MLQSTFVVETSPKGFESLTPYFSKCTGVHVPLGVHLGFSRATLLRERISLFKLDSVSGRNNRLKCLEFSNPVDCNYVKQDN